mgnify:CR=1 FL=1
MITIIVMFILIQYKVQLTINSSKNEDVIEILQNVRLYFVLTISMLSIKTLNYFLKKNNNFCCIFVSLDTEKNKNNEI